MLAVLLLLSFFTLPTWAACTITSSGMSDVAKKQLELECLKAEEAAKATPIPDTAKISAYAGVAMEVAQAIGVAANNLGVEVNKFITTPAGILTVAIILAKIFGNLIGIILAALMLNIVIFRIIRRLWTVQTDKTVEVSSWFSIGGSKKTVPVKRFMTWNEAPELQVGATFLLVVLALGSIIAIPIVGI